MHGQHALRMKLHALDGQLAVAQRHDRRPTRPSRPRRDLQLLRQSLLGHNQRVVARAGHGRRNPREDRPPVVLHLAGLAVHQLRRANDLAAERRADRLVPQAHAENRHPPSARPRQPRKVPDQLDRDPRVLRRARPRRDQDVRWTQRLHLGGRQLIVAAHDHLRAQLAHVLDEVVGKRIVVVENEDHRCADFILVLSCYCWRARSIARTTARALFAHSTNSFSGTESATSPAPA